MRKAVLFGMIALAGCVNLQAFPAQNPLPDAPSAKQTVYQPGGEVIAPKLVYSVAPEFSDEARKKRVQGVTALSIVVDETGKPRDIKVTRSLAEDVAPKLRYAAKTLDDKAVEAAKQYRYRPGMLKGKPVAVAIPITVDFNLF